MSFHLCRFALSIQRQFSNVHEWRGRPGYWMVEPVRYKIIFDNSWEVWSVVWLLNWCMCPWLSNDVTWHVSVLIPMKVFGSGCSVVRGTLMDRHPTVTFCRGCHRRLTTVCQTSMPLGRHWVTSFLYQLDWNCLKPPPPVLIGFLLKLLIMYQPSFSALFCV